jgi:o-succinylbenzoate---CoA ligase
MFFEINPAHIHSIPEPENPYFKAALDFCKEWQSGQTEFVRHTSGSTGEPKAITLTRTQMQASATLTQKALALNSNFTVLIALNINYIAGTMLLVRAMEVGMTMIITEPSSNPLVDIPADLQIDFAAFVPLQVQTMIEVNLIDRLNAMKVIIVGGAAVGGALADKIKTVEVPIYSTYGMTETVSHVALRRLNGPDCSEFYTLLDGILANTDDRGCLAICGQVSNNQWIQTNDAIKWQTERAFKIIGRADNIINSGGVKIQLEKVEIAIGKTWNRSERFYCWSQADERLGQCLVLVVESTLSDFKIPTDLKLHLTKYEIPKITYTIPQFIETPTGKIDKKATFANTKTPNI